MANWFETMAGGTRGQLLVLLRRSRRTITELAARLGISDNAVRTHIASLQRDGMVEAAGLERTTGGKPAHLYRITVEAEELFPKAYVLVLGELLRLLDEREGRDAVVALLRELGARVAAARPVADGSPGERVEAAAAVLRELGGDLEVERTGTDWEIRGYGCPLSAVVGEYPGICALAEALVEEMTGRTVIECCDRRDRPRCAFRVSGDHLEPA